MTAFIYQWIDLIWLPIGWFVVHERHRVMTVVFVLTCLITLRMQAELMESIGHGTGIMRLMDSSVQGRGMVVYSIVIALFLILAHFSPRTRDIIFFGAVLTIYLFTFCLSMLIMLL